MVKIIQLSVLVLVGLIAVVFLWKMFVKPLLVMAAGLLVVGGLAYMVIKMKKT